MEQSEDTTYKIFTDYCEQYNLLQPTKKFITVRMAKRQKVTNELNHAKELINKCTEWLDGSMTLKMNAFKDGITQENYQCPVDGCQGTRKWSTKNTRWSLTCNNQDTKHKKYIQQVSLKKSYQTQVDRYGGWVSQTQESKDKRIKTNMARFGAKTYAETDEFKRTQSAKAPKYTKKRIATNLERYGVEFANQSPEIKKRNLEATRASIFKEYGVDHWTKTPKLTPEKRIDIRDKVFDTNLKKYNCKVWAHNPENLKKLRECRAAPEVKQKIEASNLKKYGFLYPQQTPENRAHLSVVHNAPEMKDRIKKIHFRKYGGLFATQVPATKERIRLSNITTSMNKYTVCYPAQDHYNKENFKKLSKEFIEDNFITDHGNFMNKKFQEFVNCSATSAYNIVQNFGVTYKYINGHSMPEQEIIEYIQSIVDI